MFRPQFQATRQLCTVFWTSFSFLTKVAYFKKNDNRAECFDANFKQKDSCARCFWQLSDFNRSRQFLAKRKLRRVFWRQLQWTGQLRTMFMSRLRCLTKIANFKQNVSCAQCFDATFGQQDSCARCFGHVLASYQKTPSWSKSKVAESVLTPISSNRTVAHGLLDKF